MTTKATVCANGPDCYKIMIPRILPSNHGQAPSQKGSNLYCLNEGDLRRKACGSTKH